MFEKLSDSFCHAINKIRFKDDEKALKKALDELKKALLKADVHFKIVKDLIKKVETDTKKQGIGKESFLNALKDGLREILQKGGNHQGFTFAPHPPTVVLMTGLQGSGKTTSTAKLGFYLKSRGKKVLLAACDLQRLAAVEQLRQLSVQIEVDFFSMDSADPVETAKYALKKAQDGLYDVLLVDTAGRLAIDDALMNELSCIKQAIKPFETFYVADSLSGQDGIRSAKTFHERIGISSVLLSKFDGDSKGGIALSVAYELEIPLRFIGSGEKIADLDPFIPDRVINRLMGAGDIETLAEKTAAVVNTKDIKEVTKKIKKGNFTFNDFLTQLDKMKNVGSMHSILGMIPGMNSVAHSLKDMDLDNSKEIKHMRAIVNSMTPKEREDSSLLNGSRRKRIAKGAGLSVADVNRLVKQFENAAKMAKRFSNKKGGLFDVMSLLQQSSLNKFKG